MDLTEIVSVAGVAGLHKVVGRRPAGLILETLDSTKKRFATGVAQKVSFLEDISMYTQDGDVKLKEVLVKLNDYVKGGKKLPGKDASNDDLKNSFKEILPGYDQDRVYASDIKKLFAWYGILQEQLDFDSLLKEEEADGKEEGTEAKKPAKSNLKKEVAPKTKSSAPKTTGAKGAKASTPRKTGTA